jgi:two-component system OmpR family response regulator
MQNTPAPLADVNKPLSPGDDKRWNVRALIVDDDIPIRELLIDYLARARPCSWKPSTWWSST